MKSVCALEVFAVLGAMCGMALSEDNEGQNPTEGSNHTARAVVVVEGDVPVKVKIGDIVRVIGSGPAGMVEVSVKTEGPLKLVATNDIREFINGHPKIGSTIREFEAKATGKGQAKVVVTINNHIQKKTETKEFNIEVE